MKIWVDDVRTPPNNNYVWCKSVIDTVRIITEHIQREKYINAEGARIEPIEILDLDHDAGDYASAGGDYIRILDWLERKNISVPIRIHSMNPVGVQNMRAIIHRNGWTEIR